MTKKDVGQIVQKHLQQQEHPEGITIRVLEADIRRERGFWYVPVLPSAQPRKMYAYYEVLAEVETDLEEKDNLNVLFVPVVPEEVAVD